MKVLVSVLVILLYIGYVGGLVKADYEWSRDYGSNWELADKSSTLKAKSEYIDKFVTSLDTGEFRGRHNALVFTTPNNSFDENLNALKTLQGRLAEIKELNPNSFEYQQAIQQITAQEQGEAGNMIGVMKGVWYLENHLLYWNWVGGVIGILFMVIIIPLCFTVYLFEL